MRVLSGSILGEFGLVKFRYRALNRPTAVTMIANDGHAVIGSEDKSSSLVAVKLREQSLRLSYYTVHHLDICHVLLVEYKHLIYELV